MGGVIGTRAFAAYAEFRESVGDVRAENAFDALFAALVRVGVDGEPTRRVARVTEFDSLGGKRTSGHEQTTIDVQTLIDRFADERVRLLVRSQDAEGQTTVDVAHEALFREWSKLARWIGARRVQEREIAQAEAAGRDWADRAYPLAYLSLPRLHDAHRALRALGRGPADLSDDGREYLFPRQSGSCR